MNNNKKETFTKIKQIYSELLNKINVNKLDKKNEEIFNGLQRTIIENKSIKVNRKTVRRNLEKFFTAAVLTTPLLMQSSAKPITKRIESKFIDNVSLKIKSGKELTADFYSNSLKIYNSYQYNFEERVDALNQLLTYAQNNDIKISRSLKKLESEWYIHNMCYSLGLEKERAKDADLDYVEDERWYVNFATDVASIFYCLHCTFDSYVEDVNVR